MRIILSVLLASLFVTAETVAEAKQSTAVSVETQAPASKEDLEKATRKMERAMRRAIDTVEQKSAEEITIERENIRKQSEALQKIQEEKHAEEMKRVAAEAKAKSDALLASQESARVKYVSATIIAVILLGFIIILARGRKSNTSDVEVPYVKNEDSSRFVLTPHLRLEALRSHVEQTDILRQLYQQGEVKFPCTLEIPHKEGSEVNGMMLNCVVTLRNGDAYVEFDDMPGKVVSWGKRNRLAVDVALQLKAKAA